MGLLRGKKSEMRSSGIGPGELSVRLSGNFLTIFLFPIFRKVWILCLLQEKKRRKQNQLICTKQWDIRFRTFCLNKNSRVWRAEIYFYEVCVCLPNNLKQNPKKKRKIRHFTKPVHKISPGIMPGGIRFIGWHWDWFGFIANLFRRWKDLAAVFYRLVPNMRSRPFTGMGF